MLRQEQFPNPIYSINPVLTSDFDYNLPQELIAQVPLEPRHSSRLFVLDRQINAYAHRIFWDIDEYLNPGDLLVLNETRVLRARIFARKLPGGGKIEILLLKMIDPSTWEVLVGGSGMNPGRTFEVEGGLHGEVVDVLGGSNRLVRFASPIEPVLEQVGHVPLPPYIHTSLADPERYQTVYAHKPGSAAAPTAGLHFTPELFDKLEKKGVRKTFVNLQVGLDTFAPVTEEKADEHKIHTEWCSLPQDTLDAILQTRKAGGRVIAVGTTSVRTLESAAAAAFAKNKHLDIYEGSTNLYILPGFQFRVVDAMITNFHLPKSTLMMLVSAFAGRERIMAAYREAVSQRYRFFSFGDAMLIL
jgi:S-adenosylmethionine:tRNA ribosyltransferase-isomerase